MIKELCILGGGTSGMVCALIQRVAFPNLNITVVESPTIGIVGVGEGSTEHWRQFMEYVGIGAIELLKETGATFKSGIRFTNWNGDGKEYFHSINAGFTKTNFTGISSVFAYLIAQGADPLELIPASIAQSVHFEPFDSAVNQYHFDTFKLNAFLHKKCKERNINIVEADIIDTLLDEDGNVNQLVTADNQKINADFFIDCSGFKRVISSKLGAKWISVGKQLPMNSAIAFPTGYKEEIPSHTISTAVNAGWMWRIPTQERFGNGYVFCDNFISEEDAIKEAQSYFEEPIQVGRKFKFEAGYVDKFWIKNCVAMGLAGSFVEPLEASSIGTSIQQSFGFQNLISMWQPGSKIIEDTYNRHFSAVVANIVDFVQLHYITKRDDTEFWRWCKSNIELTDFNQQTLEEFKRVLPTSQFFGDSPYNMFGPQSWIMVMQGLDLFDTNSILEILNSQEPGTYIQAKSSLEELKMFLSKNVPVPHREVLKQIMAHQECEVVSFEK